MRRIGLVGWRGMVGSVLLDRMRAENDFQHFESVFFSTSQAGGGAPDAPNADPTLHDAFDLAALRSLDAIVSCQGGDYTTRMHAELRASGWRGYWIDAASSLRMNDDAVIILDPINRPAIDVGLKQGIKDYIGGNCTVSLMLMAVGALFQRGWVEWLNSSTYQAASGAGAKNMRELVAQMQSIGDACRSDLSDPAGAILDLDRRVQLSLESAAFPTEAFGAPLAASLIPWIDKPMEDGRTREEWKGEVETNKILGTPATIPVDGLCVRIGAMRSHSQALTIKLNRDVPLDEIEGVIAESNDWVQVVPNQKEATLAKLSPAAISGTLDVRLGRLRKLRMGPEYLAGFTVGDQLLWGAAEPLRRMLRILLER